MAKSVVFVGTGIKAVSHLTIEAQATISQADMVGYLVNEPVVEKWIVDNSKKSCSFQDLYFSEKLRNKSYEKITDKIICLSDRYDGLCIAIYGHPSVYSNSAIDASKILSKKGINSIFLPGISADSCMYADLKIDPGVSGVISMDASEYLYYKKNIDTTCHFVLWQVGLTGVGYTPDFGVNHDAVNMLTKKLMKEYDENHPCTIYEASLYPHVTSRIECIKIKQLSECSLSPVSTLYIPPKNKAALDRAY